METSRCDVVSLFCRRSNSAPVVDATTRLIHDAFGAEEFSAQDFRDCLGENVRHSTGVKLTSLNMLLSMGSIERVGGKFRLSDAEIRILF